ncbi:MAG: hypothetical protein AUJ20_07040 [Comamonadaceae bacterium CG1_02_60_18]|nr:MAG: hypothetical protein AUJ20_07040 [Comamonadaceae bacterium CG1_02_60_18]PIQ54902.1 MAG: hypothetical protein COW02_04565 [Comamonadaceae bacterium CG12_big_fil_rev_8_21_14_0_65_59_15]
MYFRILNDPVCHAFTYLLADSGTRQAVLIDPQVGDLPVLRALLSEHDLNLCWVLSTHHHDSQSSRAKLEVLGAPLVQGDEDALGGRIKDGAIFPFGDEIIRVLVTPGHTLSCLSFAWRDRLFCGDVLSVNGCPQQRQPASPEALWDSATQRVLTQPDETLLFCGHSESLQAVSTVLQQRRWHPYFAGVTRDEFLARAAALQDDNRAVFV